ncbi:hypothetical protein IAR55_001855 [Kwoniella newhampshirensis]|uniref:DNA helicase n=1 Tax=Kwoniella newhampshirensis TaxID=1651941 RepID=A0AAW0Z3D8_9TREE
MKRSRHLLVQRGLPSTSFAKKLEQPSSLSATTIPRSSFSTPLNTSTRTRFDSRPLSVPHPRHKGVSNSRLTADNIDDFNHTFHRAFHSSSASHAQPLLDHDNWERWYDHNSTPNLATPLSRFTSPSPPPPPPPLPPSALQLASPTLTTREGKGKGRASELQEGDVPQGDFEIDDGVIEDLFLSSSSSAGEMADIPFVLSEMDDSSDVDLDATFPPPDTPPPPLDHYPEEYSSTPGLRTRQKRSPRRSINVRDLPPLKADEYPPDDMTRFDWRSRALGRQRKAGRSGKERYWFPSLRSVWRREGGFAKLAMGDKWRDELDRYKQHFIPLLDAEQAEEERLFEQRLTQWPYQRLHREGYVLDGLSASLPVQSKSAQAKGIVYQFARPNKQNNNPLNLHRFTSGTNVLISRTHPNEDPVAHKGTDVNGNSCRLIGSVWTVGKEYLRVLFTEQIEGVETGKWRLDIGCSDFAIKRQKEAIQALNIDPFLQDMSDYELLVSNRSESQSKANQHTLLVPPLASETLSSESDRSAAEEAAIRAGVSSSQRRKGKEQIILQGTTVRDKLFRAFQVDYVPPDQTLNSLNASVPQLSEDHVVPEAHEMRPTDLDAVPEPSLPLEETALGGSLARNQLIHSWTTRYRSVGSPIKVEGDPEVPLNPSQTRAIAMMLSERLSLVQGPPGTGKTRVIIETIKLLKQHWEVPHPILVTAHTNVAVDNLLAGLRAHGLKALRMGAVERVPESMREWTIEGHIEKHPLSVHLEMLKSQRNNILELGKKNEFGRLRPEDAQKVTELGGRIWSMKQTMMREVLVDADVICTTCLSAASRQLQPIDFPIVFLDEASMATEPLSLVPLMKGSSHTAIIGDHKQLPPVIISPEAHAGGLATSLFERLIHEGHIPSIMLDTQYRMHPDLSSFPSQTFYSGLLKNGTPAEARPAPETEFLVLDEMTGKRKNLTFLNHNHPEGPMMRSLSNWGDAEVVCDVIADLLFKNPDLKGSQIGIITPYLAQINLLSNYLSDPSRQQAFEDVLGYDRAKEVYEVEIKTVDGFEGREKEVIIFSTVRSNPGGYIGFLSDWRRVNVGLTRGRRALIMIGSKSTLSKARTGQIAAESLPQGGADVWRGFIKHLEERDMVMDLD